MPRLRKDTNQLTPLELKIMQVLWQHGPSNVTAVQMHLSDEFAYTTVQTMLNVLERKGHVKRALAGRAFEYEPFESKEIALGSAVEDMLDRMFGGSVEGLLMNLVQTKQVKAAKLEELAKRVAKAEAKK
jgi:BlaI family transcriptional regulator, penicillinase repressor